MVIRKYLLKPCLFSFEMLILRENFDSNFLLMIVNRNNFNEAYKLVHSLVNFISKKLEISIILGYKNGIIMKN